MVNVKEEAKQLLDSISREELIELLTDSGILVKNGTGKIIFLDKNE